MAYAPEGRGFGPWDYSDASVAFTGFLLHGAYWSSTAVQGPTYNGEAPVHDRRSTRAPFARPLFLRALRPPKIFLPPRS